MPNLPVPYGLITCHSSQGCQVAAVVSHDLDDEDPALGSGRRLPDLVADQRDLVQRGVRSETEFGSGHVIADRRRTDDHRDLEFGKLAPVFRERDNGTEGHEAPDEHQAVDVVLFQLDHFKNNF